MMIELETLTIDSWPFKLLGIAYGQGTRLQLEVLYSEHDRTPSPTQLRSAWKTRQDRRGVPLLVVVLHAEKAHVCGPSGEDPTVYPKLDAGQVERICLEALEQRSRQAALRSLRYSLGALEEDGLPGLRNEGFLASHELISGVPTRSDYREDHPTRRTAFRREEDRLLRKQIDTYIKLFNIGQVITSEMNFDALFDVIADQTNKILDSQRCSVFLIDDKGSYLTTFVSTDIKRNEIRIPCSHGIAGWVFSNQLPLIIEDAYSDSRFYPSIDQITGFKTTNILCVPLINRKKECIGTLQALNKISGNFTDDDREIITYLANYVTVATENAKLYEELIAADRAKERAINHLSHELRTPLSIILSAFRFIEKKAHPAEDKAIIRAAKRGRRNVSRLMEMQEKTEDIIKLRPIEESERMLTIIEDTVSILEELTESNSGSYEKALAIIKNRIKSIFAFEEHKIERINLNGALKKVLQNEMPSGLRDFPKIIPAIDDRLFIDMDRNVLKKVLIGLLKNAVEHTPDEGLIEIAARSDGDAILVDFQDYGVGISKANQKSIFSGFYHARDTNYYTSKKPYDFGAGGMGLDLLRIKIFARMYGFSLNVDSTRCQYIPRDTDQCEGRISECPHIKHLSGCLVSGGSKFTLVIPKSN